MSKIAKNTAETKNFYKILNFKFVFQPEIWTNLLALWLILFKALILRKWKTWLNAVPCLYKAGLWSASELAVFTFTFPPMFDLVSLDLDSWAQGCLDSTNFRKYCTLFSVILYSGYHCPTAQLGKSLSDLERQQCFSLELDQFDHDKYFRELCSLSNAALVLCTDNEKWVDLSRMCSLC